MQAWKEDYPWLQVAFKNWGGDWRAASESWRVRIEDELDAALDFKVRGDGTATVWCGMSGHDFHHYPTPKELPEVSPTVTAEKSSASAADIPHTHTHASGRLSEPASAPSLAPPAPDATVAVATRAGPVELSPAARDALLHQIRRRGSDDPVVRAFEQASVSEPVSLDRLGKMVVFDALWTLAEGAGSDDLIDPQLRLLRDRFREEIAQGPTAK